MQSLKDFKLDIETDAQKVAPLRAHRGRPSQDNYLTLHLSVCEKTEVDLVATRKNKIDFSVDAGGHE